MFFLEKLRKDSIEDYTCSYCNQGKKSIGKVMTAQWEAIHYLCDDCFALFEKKMPNNKKGVKKCIK